jgi:hypothetical protein
MIVDKLSQQVIYDISESECMISLRDRVHVAEFLKKSERTKHPNEQR